MLFDRPIPIPMEDDLVHIDPDPFCSDSTCPCHDDDTLIAEVSQQVEDGLLSPDEAARFVQGRQL